MRGAAVVNGLTAPAMRSTHVPGRPYLSTADAARRLGKSLYWVTNRVKNGTLDGYGIKAKERISWYVFASAIDEIERLEGPDLRPAAVAPLPLAAELVTEAMSELDALREQITTEREVTTDVTQSVIAGIDALVGDGGELSDALREMRDRLAEGSVQREACRNQVDRRQHNLGKALRGIQQLT